MKTEKSEIWLNVHNKTVLREKQSGDMNFVKTYFFQKSEIKNENLRKICTFLKN